MKRFFVLSFVAAVMLSLAGCVPHTTGETEVGVRTRKLALFGQKGVEDRATLRVPPIFFCRLSTTGMSSTPSCRTWR